jgi:regulator of nucleoside diphosphate kinase
LIGLAAGQSVVWKTRDGKERVLDIAEVEPPSLDAQS